MQTFISLNYAHVSITNNQRTNININCLKHVHPTNTAKITPPHCIHCIYNLYTNPLAPPIEATYEYLLWHSPQAQYVWNLTKKIIIQLGAKFEITSLYEIPLVFLPNAETTPSLRTSTVQHIIVASLWVIYKSELDLRTLHQTNAVTIDIIRYWISSHLHKAWVHDNRGNTASSTYCSLSPNTRIIS